MPLAVAAVLVLPALPASADAVDSAVNGSRSTALPNRAELEQVANASAARQAADGAISHSSLSGLTGICSASGEIVGVGPSIQMIFDLFLQSASHRELLLSGAWTAMGTGAVTDAAGQIYVSVVFCTELSPSAVAPTPPSPPPPSTTAGSAVTPVQYFVAAPSLAPMVSFHEVFYRLITGDLSDIWLALSGQVYVRPDLGPSPFVPLSAWFIPSAPTLN
jgi:hypothetical protein